MRKPAKLLLVFVDEGDFYDDQPVYEYLLRWFLQLGLQGATVTRGIMSFGSRHHLHGRGLSRVGGMNDERPVTVMVIASEDRLSPLLPEIHKLAPDALITLSDIEVWKPDES